MFYGSVPAEAQAIMNKIIKSWEVSDIYVGCSGNFTIEKFVGPLGRFTLHSNDVTLYSQCLGCFFSGKPVPLELSEEGEKELGWLKEYMKTDADKIATLMLCTRIVTFLGKGDNEYYKMMLEENIKQFPTMHQKTVEKISKNELHIKDYFNGDGMQFVQEAPDDCGFVCFPPFRKAGKAFVKDFAKLEKLFLFTPPEYEFFDEERLKSYFREIMKKKEWCFATDIRLVDEEFLPYLKGMSKTTNRGIPIYIYASHGKSQIVTPFQSTVQMNIHRFAQGMEIGEKIKLNILSNDAFQTLRSQYMNINIRPGSATLAIGVTIDDYLIGVYAFSASPTLSNWDKHIETPTMYLLSDFPVEPVDYKHLAKLVLYAALSKESKQLAERITKRRVASLVTTAFSKNPESMKYRGLFKVLNRKHNDSLEKADWAKDIDPSNAYYLQPYEINYGAPMGQWTLEEGFAMWKKKSSQKRQTGEVIINE